jgi:hypothetical protein
MIADDNKRRDYNCSAEGANIRCESLRQKNSYLTQLWRALRREAEIVFTFKPPKRKAYS